MASSTDRLHSTDLDVALKSTMIVLCCNLGLPHGGLKVDIEACLRSHRSSLLPLALTSSQPATTLSPPATIMLVMNAMDDSYFHAHNDHDYCYRRSGNIAPYRPPTPRAVARPPLHPRLQRALPTGTAGNRLRTPVPRSSLPVPPGIDIAGSRLWSPAPRHAIPSSVAGSCLRCPAPRRLPCPPGRPRLPHRQLPMESKHSLHRPTGGPNGGPAGPRT